MRRACVLAAFFSSGLARADASVPESRRAEWAECRAALEAAARQLAAEGWGIAAEEASIVESADGIELHIDFSTGCMHHGGAGVVIRRGKKPKLDYWDRNESETATRQQPEPFYRRMRQAIRKCRGV